MDGHEPVTRSTGRAAAPGDVARGEGRADDRRPGRGAVGVLQRPDRAAGHPRAADGGRGSGHRSARLGDRGPERRGHRAAVRQRARGDVGPVRRALLRRDGGRGGARHRPSDAAGPGQRRGPPALLGPGGREPGRGPVPHRLDHDAVRAGGAGAQRHREPQALRRLPAGGGPRHRPEHGDQRSRADGDLGAPLPGRDREGRPRVGDVLVQQDQRRLRVRERLRAGDGAARAAGLRRVRDHRLRRAPLDGAVDPRRHRHGDRHGRLLRRGAAGGGQRRDRPGVAGRPERPADPPHDVRGRRLRHRVRDVADPGRRSTAPSPARSRRTRSRSCATAAACRSTRTPARSR